MTRPAFGTCPRCGRALSVIDSRIVGEWRIRYYGCRRRNGKGCGYRPAKNIEVVPADGMKALPTSGHGMNQPFATDPDAANTSAGGTENMFAELPAERIERRAYSLEQVAVAYNLSPSRIAGMVARGLFPAPAIAERGARRWLASQLEAWEQQQAQKQGAGD